MKSLSLNRPHAIFMVGLPGSGKSFFAKQFAETFNAPFVDSRTISTYTSEIPAAEKLSRAFLNELVKTKQTFIYEGFTDSRVKRTEFAQWARAHGYQPLLIWVQTDERTALGRTVKTYDMPKKEFEEIVHNFSPPHSLESPIVISGKHTYAAQARVVLKHLSSNNRSGASVPSSVPIERTPPPQTPERRSITVR